MGAHAGSCARAGSEAPEPSQHRISCEGCSASSDRPPTWPNQQLERLLRRPDGSRKQVAGPNQGARADGLSPGHVQCVGERSDQHPSADGGRRCSEDSTLRLSLLTHALKRGVWLIGLAFMIASFLTQAVALHLGDLSQVQPILTTELLFLIIILATWFRFRIGRGSGWGAWPRPAVWPASCCSPSPVGGTRYPRHGDGCWWAHLWWRVILAVVLALRGPRWWRAAMFGTAGAIGFAFTAALIKSVAGYVATDWVQMFVHWETYALALCGVASLFLAQNAYHAGPIAASQTALVLVDPLASLAIGIGLFGDNLRTAGAYGPLEALSLVIMFAGAASIAHSPLISGMKGDDDRYAEMLSLRSWSKRLIEAVQDTVPLEAVEQLPPGSSSTSLPT